MGENLITTEEKDMLEVTFIIQNPFKVAFDSGTVSEKGRMSLPTELLRALLVDDCCVSGEDYMSVVTGVDRPGPHLRQRVRNIISSVATKTSPTELMGTFAGILAYGPVEIGVQCCSGCGLFAARSPDLAAHWLNLHPYEAMRMGLWASVHAELDALAQAVRAESQLAASADGKA